jgi:hypothetical protein
LADRQKITEEQLTEDPASQALGLVEVKERPFNPDHDRERKRGIIALRLVYCLLGIDGFSLLYLTIYPDKTESLKQVLDILMSPIVGLVGAATGFYFGEKSRH